ncbi:MAG: aldolase, partial [Planctomycetia bacterium]|nr:aldolase [Planctomycetia bacterium]
MRPNRVKQATSGGAVSIGTFVFEFGTTGVGRIAAEAGAEFAIFDMEHTGWGFETIRMLIATTRPTEMVPMVRVAATESHFIARVLDLGASGVMVPMVETAEQARRIVRAARYPPAGRRGAAFGVAHDDYTGGDLVAKMRSADREVLLVAQIETARGLEDVEAIAAVEGIDVLWVGHFDLTNALGIPGRFTDPTYLEAVDRVIRACRAHGKAPGIMASDVADGKTQLARGFRMIAYGGDLWLYQQALRQGIASLRSAA